MPVFTCNKPHFRKTVPFLFVAFLLGSVHGFSQTHTEVKTGVVRDSIYRHFMSDISEDSADHQNNKVGLTSLLSGQTIRNSHQRTLVKFAPLGNAFSYNTVEGFALSPGFSYTRFTTEASSFTLGSTLRYGFSNHRFNAAAQLDWNLDALTHSNLSLEGGSVVADQNNLGGIAPLYNTFQSLLWKINPLKIYEKHFLALGYSRDLIRQLNLGAGLEYANRIPLVNTDYAYISGASSQHFTANEPYGSAGNKPAFTLNQAMTLHLTAKIIIAGNACLGKDQPVPADKPSMFIEYRKGIKGPFGSRADYDFLSAGISQREIHTGRMGKFNYSVSGGRFLTHKNLIYLDYQHFTSSSSTPFQRAESFELLSSYHFSASRYYIHGHVEQNIGDPLFSGIPVLRELRLEQYIGASYMKNNLLNNYAEIYIGIQSSTFRISYAFGFKDGKTYLNDFTVNIGGF